MPFHSLNEGTLYVNTYNRLLLERVRVVLCIRENGIAVLRL